MQQCIALPWHAVVGVLIATQCSALMLEEGLRGHVEADVNVAVTYNVEYAKGLINCPKGVLASNSNNCGKMPLLLDIYKPGNTSTNGRPAVLVVHGGCNKEGTKDTQTFTANFWAQRGYVVFVPDYRLQEHHGNYPGEDFWVGNSSWRTLYPAVRDVKASLRYIVANADTYNVDTSRIIALGSSAGAMDALAAFAANNNTQFTTEFSLEQDPTLSSVHQGLKATAQAIVMKSGVSWGVQSYSVFSGAPAPWEEGGKKFVVDGVRPLMQIHGTADEVIPLKNANTTADFWERAGAKNCLLVLPGAGHLQTEHGLPHLDPAILHGSSLDKLALNFVQSLDASTDGTFKCPEIPPA